ncbi:hypothetical protein VTN96DRAFT_5742 [Rasamsonia emersonii]
MSCTTMDLTAQAYLQCCLALKEIAPMNVRKILVPPLARRYVMGFASPHSLAKDMHDVKFERSIVTSLPNARHPRRGSTIRFLPATCAIRLDPPRWDFHGISPAKPPQWNNILGPRSRVGMSVDRAIGFQKQ